MLEELGTVPEKLDVIVAVDGDEVVAELDVAHNARVRVGDRYTAAWEDGTLTIMRVSEFKSPEGYVNSKARRTEAMREGVAGIPNTRPARMAYQRKLAVLHIEGELSPAGERKTGAARVPDVMIPIKPITDDYLERFATTPDGNLILGNLMSGSRKLRRVARVNQNYAGDRMVVFGMPGKGKTQLVRSILAQAMAETAGLKSNRGFLILDRKGEYIKDTLDQRGNTVYGLHHHPNAAQQMVIVSPRQVLNKLKGDGAIFDYLPTQFSIKDIEPVDLADFLTGLTKPQADIVRDYAHIDDFYKKLLAETQFGMADKSHWIHDFPGLFDLNDKGKKFIKDFETEARAEEREELTAEELEKLEPFLGGTKHSVLERAGAAIKRFCLNPFFGSSKKGRAILGSPSCVEKILGYLSQGKVVFLDMRGQSDEDYTMVAAIFARRLLSENKTRDDSDHIRACLILEEAHNILSEKELEKGSGTGSVFIELAREGRSFKLGFILVTQQPDAKSIAPQVAKTIDTIVAFNMPPEDAKHLTRLKTGFQDLELEISNAREFHGVAVSVGGSISFCSAPVDDIFMKSSVDSRFAHLISSQGDTEPISQADLAPATQRSLDERLVALSQQRRENIQKVALETMEIWAKGRPETPSDLLA